MFGHATVTYHIIVTAHRRQFDKSEESDFFELEKKW